MALHTHHTVPCRQSALTCHSHETLYRGALLNHFFSSFTLLLSDPVIVTGHSSWSFNLSGHLVGFSTWSRSVWPFRLSALIGHSYRNFLCMWVLSSRHSAWPIHLAPLSNFPTDLSVWFPFVLYSCQLRLTFHWAISLTFPPFFLTSVCRCLFHLSVWPFCLAPCLAFPLCLSFFLFRLALRLSTTPGPARPVCRPFHVRSLI
jgi:hypothetical protein